jgi:hypothetical protein
LLPRAERCSDRLIDLLRRYRRAVELGLERAQRVADGVGDHRRRRDRAAFADAFDAERIERRRRVLVDDCYVWVGEW